MLWLVLSILSGIIWAFGTFLDNYIADVTFKNRRPQAIKVFNSFSYLLIALIIFLFFGVEQTAIATAAWLLAAGIITSIASIPYYAALKHEESTGSAIYYQLQPIFYLLADLLIFHKSISFMQGIALFILMLAPVIIISSRRRQKARKRALSTAAIFILYVFLLSVGSIITTHATADSNTPYLTVFFYFMLGRGISDSILCLTQKSWRARFKYVARHDRKRLILSLSAAQILSIIGEFTTRLALALSSAAIVAALVNSFELILIFIFGIILTLKWPEFGREKLNRHIIVAHLVAILLCISGILILQFA